ncbi:hypothetical protein ALC60_07651 [Trachymyrmex zeteki]|uniref:Uncharacterized protein n=1 Tax=Mycetomoellerius zeteki TaxID=64791 RepID=A0A151WZA4_9HYME|nr:hypothetical protein ALC60_07651 [Trachymyrmex zeteki]
MICHTHATGSNRTTRDTDDDDDDEEEDDEEKDDTRPLRGHATSTLCARMRPARLLPDQPDCPSTHQQRQKQQQRLQRLRKKGKKLVSRQTSTGVKSKDVYRLPLSLSRVKEATPKSSTTITEQVPRLDWDWRDLRVQRTASAEPTTTVQPSRRRRRRNPGALAFPRRCGAVVRSTGVG